MTENLHDTGKAPTLAELQARVGSLEKQLAQEKDRNAIYAALWAGNMRCEDCPGAIYCGDLAREINKPKCSDIIPQYVEHIVKQTKGG